MKFLPAFSCYILVLLWANMAHAQYRQAVDNRSEVKISQNTERIADLERRISRLERVFHTQKQAGNTLPHPNPADIGGRKTPVSGNPVVHVIQRGETLSGISRMYGVTVASLAQANRMHPDDQIYVGDRIMVPAGSSTPSYGGGGWNSSPQQASYQSEAQGGSYTVQPGDTLSRIASMHGVTVAQLVDANRLANPDRLEVGQTLIIPGQGYQSTLSQGYQSSNSRQTETGFEEDLHFYEVMLGDTLSSIAETFFTTVSELRTINKLKSDALSAGQQLKVPTKRYFEFLESEGAL